MVDGWKLTPARQFPAPRIQQTTPPGLIREENPRFASQATDPQER
jgi:hypothetical protein